MFGKLKFLYHHERLYARFISCLRRSSIACCCCFNCRTRSRMAIQLGTGQLDALHCLAWICRSAQILLHTLQPPVAFTWHCAPCFSRPFILVQFAEGHLGEVHVAACKRRVICSWMLRCRSFRWASVNSVGWPLATGMGFSWWGCRTFGLDTHSWHWSKSAQVGQWNLYPVRISREHVAHCCTNLGASLLCRCQRTIIEECLALLTWSNW